MTSPYLITIPAFGSGYETVLDRARLARDIAEAIGGTVVVEDDEDETRSPQYASARFTVGDLLVYLSRDGFNAKNVGRVKVSCGAPRTVARRLAGQIRIPEWPSITLDSARPLDAIVKAIRARVIEPAAPILAAQLAEFAKMDQDGAAIREQRAVLLMRFPFLRIDEPDERGNSVQVYGQRGNASLSARLTSGGALYVDRLSYGGAPVDLLTFLFGESDQ